MSLILVARLTDIIYWHKNLKKNYSYSYVAELRFKAGALLTATMWSIYTVIFFDSMSLIELACTVVILSAMAGGATTVLAGSKLLAMSYAVILLIPISICGLTSNIEYQQILGILGVIFAFVMFTTAKRSSQFTKDSIVIKNQNVDLLQQMQKKNQEILDVNETLEVKVKQRTEEIFELSNIDPLTRLFNRNAFLENIKPLIAKPENKKSKMALLFIDLDGFKSINDSFGHSVGDKVLTITSERLVSLADEQKILCRWGGDEFLFALESYTVENAQVFAQRIIDLLSHPIEIEHHLLNVGATVGIAMFPEHGTNETQLIALADTAMFKQKQTAKSQVRVFSADLKEDIDREQFLRTGLSTALDKNQMYLVFQPVICSKTKDVAFCEALLRWEIDGELISPNEFVSIAEQHGSIHSIGAWVLHQACQVAANWCFGDNVHVSVNVSISQFLREDILKIVESALAKSQLPAHNLHIEITESIFAENINIVLKQIEKLKALKIKVSVDDFGTGFSSLALLQTLSADTVKIDQAFVKTLNSGGKAIIQATQHMASELGYQVVAEGIETLEQATIAQQIGVEYLQGFYFAKPLKSGELMAWLHTYQLSNVK